MKIDLIDYDGKIPNLALMRLSAYHKKQHHKVQLFSAKAFPTSSRADKIYLSCIFAWNRATAQTLATTIGPRCIMGGTGIDISRELPQAVQHSEPDYSIYPACEYAIGFISRGCIRKCPWCVVPTKEGKLRRESTAKDIVGHRERAVFLDNNFLALEDCYKDL